MVLSVAVGMTFISLLAVVIGFVMVHRTNNYENIWGAMLWYGLAFLVICLISLVVVGIFSLIF